MIAAAPPAIAGSAESPEVTDPEGDCSVPYGNEYLDVVSAWISDETDARFQVNLALAKWNEPIADGSAFTVQFTHQGVTWGVVASYVQAFGGWSYSTGRATADEAGDFQDTTGSFTPGTPAVLQMAFPKRIFPHADATDNALREFTAGSADLRPAMPFFVAEDVGAPVSSDGRWIICDEAASDAVYEFQVGRHAAHDARAEAADERAEPEAADAEPDRDAAPAADDAPADGGEDARSVPAPAGVAAVAAAALALGRRRFA